MSTKKKIKGKQTEVYSGPKVILVTGAAGYVGAMLCDQFSQSPDLKEIVAVDKEPMPEFLKGNKKIRWITSELSTGDWAEEARKVKPEVVIHAAWQIKELYGEAELQRKLNIDASKAVFSYAFAEPSVKKLIHFSTVSVYGAFDNNSEDKLFVEGDMMRENEYRYGSEKKEVEEILLQMYGESDRTKKIFVVRPATIMGPRGKYMIGKKGLLHMLENKMPFIPVATDAWGRQYVHEDDVTDIVAMLTFNPVPGRYEVFNLSPKDLILGKDFAQIFEKETLWVPSFIVEFIFPFAWHLTQGKLVSGSGSWRFLCYPIFVDGTKISRYLKYMYQYTGREAITAEKGRYEYAVPKRENDDKSVVGNG